MSDFDDLMKEAEDEGVEQDQEGVDPFDPHNLAISQFITTARVYDALLLLLTKTDKEAAKNLMEIHASGALMGSQPSFNGTFVTDVVNSQGDVNTQSDKINNTEENSEQ